jgi:hypothetical protein
MQLRTAHVVRRSVRRLSLLLLTLVHVARTDAQPVPVDALPLIVANPAGLHALANDGKLLRTLTKTPASRPRLLAGNKELLFLRQLEDFSIELRKLNLNSGQEELVVKVPRLSYEQFQKKIEGEDASNSAAPLRVYSDEGFRAGPAAVCLYLTNHNSNMADLEADVRVELATKKVQILHRGCAGPDCQKGLSFSGRRDEGCKTGDIRNAEASPPKKAYPFFIEDQRLMSRASNGAKKTIADLRSRSGWGWDEIGTFSSSLRYTTLQGNLEQESDSLLRQVVLLDKQTGNIYPISTPDIRKLGQSVSWPKPLTKGQLLQLRSGERLATLTVGVDSPIRAVGTDDKLLVEQLLLIPGKAIVYLDGHLAF